MIPLSKADFAPDGNLVVLDGAAQEVRIFDRYGEFVEQFGGAGKRTPGAAWRHGILASPRGVRWNRTGPLRP